MSCFYEKGLRFTCKGCRYCCGVEPGFVFLSENDILRLAKHFCIDEESFLGAYCRKIGNQFSLISLLEKPNFDCIFLSEKGCDVYEDRPLQCKCYPFWDTIVESKENWQNEGRYCPGIGSGQLHDKNEIDALLKEQEKNRSLIKW